MKKKVTVTILALALVCGLTACGSSGSSGETENAAAEEGPLDLTGVWDTEDNDGSWMEAVIGGETITIDWVSDNGETRSVYWVGTYEPPTEPTDNYSWTSERDADRTDMALLASGDDTKEFTYEDGDLSYSASMLGTTTTMHMTRTSETVPDSFVEIGQDSEETVNDLEDTDISEETVDLEETEELAQTDASSSYGIGETWTVEDQWALTIDGVSTTDDRNEYSEEDPKQVIVIDYHYENQGYEQEYWDGLYLSLDLGILVDADGNVCSEYPIDVKYPQETPVGATCTAQCAFGLMSDGNTATLTFSQYDGNDIEQSAVFDLNW